MFTQEELNEIVAAHKAVYKAILPSFNGGATSHEDMRAAEAAAARIVAAKIIAQGKQ